MTQTARITEMFNDIDKGLTKFRKNLNLFSAEIEFSRTLCSSIANGSGECELF